MLGLSFPRSLFIKMELNREPHFYICHKIIGLNPKFCQKLGLNFEKHVLDLFIFKKAYAMKLARFL